MHNGRVALTSLVAVALLGAWAPPEQAVEEVEVARYGERVDPIHFGESVIEGWDVVQERDANRPPEYDSNPRDREDAQGEWVVPGRSASFHPHSGVRYVTNKWGDTMMGIGFPTVVALDSVWVAGQAGEGVWPPAIRAIGYRRGVEIDRTDWFTTIGARPALFEIDFVGVDRVVFEAQAAVRGAAWYGLDDLAYTRLAFDGNPEDVVIDFEDAAFRQTLTDSGYRGLTWELGFGPFEDEGVPAPQDPNEDDEEEDVDVPAGGGFLGGGEIGGGVGGATLPQLVSNYQGTIRGDAGEFSWPPDTCGAVGATQFMIAVNRTVAVFRKSDGAKVMEASLGSFQPGTSGDPRILFDQYTDRWIVLSTNFNNRIYLAVSLTSDATGSWFKTNFNVSQGPDSGRWPDYPTLGVNEDGIFTASYMVGSPAQMSIFAIDKTPLVSASPSLGAVTAFRELPWEGAMQPVHTYGDVSRQYIVSQPGGDIRVREITGNMNNPSLSAEYDIDLGAFDTPPNAPALGSATPLNTVGTRLMNAMYINGFIYTANTIGVDGRAAARWYKLNPSAQEMDDFGTISDDVLNYFFPSIAANDEGDIAIGFSGSYDGQYAGAYYTGRRVTDLGAQVAVPFQYRAGAAPQNLIDGFGRNRWGDYSLTSVDPVDMETLWTVQEYAHADNIWGTQIAEMVIQDGPVNDFCQTLSDAFAGATPFTTIGATTDGYSENGGCFNGGNQIFNDVWFRFRPPCNGTATIRVCDATFPVRLAVYSGCVDGPDQADACDEGSCEDGGGGAEVTLTVATNHLQRIRIGSPNGEVGTCTLEITCIPDETGCTSDLNGDGLVGFADLVELLTLWGVCPGCPADLDSSGAVDFGDVVILLGAWGPCE